MNSVLGISNLDPAGKLRSQFNYNYDPAGEIVRWGQQNAGNTPVQYALDYDKAGQLVAAQGSLNGATANADQYFYNYDPGSNRTSSENSTVESVQLSGSATVSDVLTITVNNTQLSGGSESVNYTVQSGDTLSSIAAKLAAAMTADANLQTVGVNAISDGTFLKIKAASPNVTSYAESTNSGATESIALGVNKNSIQNASISISGAGFESLSGDVLSLKVFDAALSGGSELFLISCRPAERA